ncbi:2Fe-2S iron-sulfur cluster-binding protein [Pantanalinema sp. GBBB05]|uniref:2Fe-2S iron-sulfur cluster-binding protein n=1 Tax=Pantanalinema sp. GBBB05 TaxID=2604139 RepID=UPI001DCA0E52|nr:(2Fe-2S)-binding protein [Pantanalinema sp. GBBB05]
MSDLCTIRFPATGYPAITLAAHVPLSHHLTLQNSPVLFGCRTGICGTCLVEVTGDLPPPDADEQEMLDALAPGAVNVRLACQIDLVADIAITVPAKD